jgi:hypothetical protein
MFSCRTLMLKAHLGDDLKIPLYGDVSEKSRWGCLIYFLQVH